MAIQTSWSQIKSFVDNRSISIQWVDMADYYWLMAFDGPFSLEVKLNKDGSADQIDFETNYRDATTANRHPTAQVTQTLGEDNYSVRSQGTSFTATLGTTTEHRYAFSMAYSLNGGSVYTQNAAVGDSIQVDIIDTRNNMGFGVDFILPGSDFIGPGTTKWMIFPGQPQVIKDLSVTDLPVADLDIRTRYTSVGGTNVDVMLNFDVFERT